jgi:hypothetical protein
MRKRARNNVHNADKKEALYSFHVVIYTALFEENVQGK